MREAMSKTSGNLQGELAQRDDEISKLTRKLQDLEKELIKIRKEKEEEIDRREKDKTKFEAKIKELEEKIHMLQSESGDLVQ